jgi:RimJ/RimL family protein N-acetyltransferase
MRLETARLVLRPPTLDDLAVAAELAGDPEVMRFIGGTLPAEQFIAQWTGWWQADRIGPFLVERRADGRFLGRVGVHAWDTRGWSLTTRTEAGPFAQPELGWILVRDAWGNGYATEAARAVLDWHGVDELVSVIAPDNVASQGVARRLGGSPGETVLLFETRPAVVWRYAA